MIVLIFLIYTGHVFVYDGKGYRFKSSLYNSLEILLHWLYSFGQNYTKTVISRQEKLMNYVMIIVLKAQGLCFKQKEKKNISCFLAMILCLSVSIYVRGIRNNSILYYVLLVDGSKINSINVSF